MQNFYTLHIDPVALELPAADSCEIHLRRATVADSFVIVPISKLHIPSLPADALLLPNDPGSVYEVRFFSARKPVASGFFDMPSENYSLELEDLKTAWPYPPPPNYILELVAGTGSPDVGQEMGSYAPVKAFTLSGADAHVIRTDSSGTVVVLVDRIRNGTTETVGEFSALDGEGVLTVTGGVADFAAGDVLRLLVQVCPGACQRITITMLAKFES